MTEDMPRPRHPHLRHERNRHGKWVWYFRRDNGPRIRMPGEFGSPEFKEAYQAALRGETIEKPTPARSGSVAWLVSRYKESGKFLSNAPSTQYFRANFLRIMVEKVGDRQFTKITRKDIQRSMDARAATPHQANNLLTAVSQLFEWAVKNEHLKLNPCDGIEPFKTKDTGGHHTWTVEEVEQYRAHHKVGTRARLALDLLLFTGLRRSDIILIGRQHVKDGILSVRTTKTGAKVDIPIFPELRASIEATKEKGDLAFIVGQRGRPFRSPIAFGKQFRKWCDEAELPEGCTAHGVRKAGATIAANKGASARQLMAMFGWSRISMAESYTKAADRARLARETAELIANEFSAAPEKGAAKDGLETAENKAVEN